VRSIIGVTVPSTKLLTRKKVPRPTTSRTIGTRYHRNGWPPLADRGARQTGVVRTESGTAVGDRKGTRFQLNLGAAGVMCTRPNVSAKPRESSSGGLSALLGVHTIRDVDQREQGIINRLLVLEDCRHFGRKTTTFEIPLGAWHTCREPSAVENLTTCILDGVHPL